jgi:hypothetical protein
MNNHYVKERIITEGAKGYNYCKKKKKTNIIITLKRNVQWLENGG